MDEGGCIYALGTEGVPFVKIGSTQQPVPDRMAQLQVGQWGQLHVLAHVRVAAHLCDIEHTVHDLLHADRVRGEWFAVEMTQERLEFLVRWAQKVYADTFLPPALTCRPFGSPIPRGRRSRTYHLDRPATSAERQQRFAQKRDAELQQLRARQGRKVYHLSQRDDWPTPWHIFDPYNDAFAFTLDVCASAANRKCARYFSAAENGLLQDWGTDICWMNPPFTQTARWMAKAYASSLAGATVVCYVATRTGRAWWHTYALRGEIRYRQGRDRFEGAEHDAPFDSAVVIFRPPPR